MMDFKPDETMLQNYIQNKLSDVDTEKVELWLVDNPEVIDDLEMDLMIKQAMIIEPRTLQVKKPLLVFLDLFTGRKLVPIHLLAYGLVGLLTFNLFNNTNTKVQSSVATFIEFEKQRGLDNSIIEVRTGDSKSLVLRFFPDSMSKKYSLIIKSKISNQQIEFTELVADNYGSITVTVNTNKFMDGRWEISLSSGPNLVEQYYGINIL